MHNGVGVLVCGITHTDQFRPERLRCVAYVCVATHPFRHVSRIVRNYNYHLHHPHKNGFGTGRALNPSGYGVLLDRMRYCSRVINSDICLRYLLILLPITLRY